MTTAQLSKYVGRIVTVSLRDGANITGRFHDGSSDVDLSSPYAVEYTLPDVDTYTHNRFHAIAKADDILTMESADI